MFCYKKAGIAVIIYSADKKFILHSTKMIDCSSSSKTEFASINKAICCINTKQIKGHIPLGSTIRIHTDCKSLFDGSDGIRLIKGISEDLISNLRKNLDLIKENNTIELNWIRRRQNKLASKYARDALETYRTKC